MSTPPVAFPIDELILQEVIETLSTISTDAGFLNDLIVEDQKQGGNAPLRDGLVVVAAGAPEPQPNPPLGFKEYLLPIGIVGYVIESEASEPAVLRGRLYSVAADIHRALEADVHRGEQAVNTEFPDKDEIDLAGSPPSVIVWAKVRFRTRYANPYQRT